MVNKLTCQLLDLEFRGLVGQDRVRAFPLLCVCSWTSWSRFRQTSPSIKKEYDNGAVRVDQLPSGRLKSSTMI